MCSAGSSPSGDALVIGYGCTLRSDDSVGPMAAEAVAGWGRPDVKTFSLHILGPDLAESIAASRLAVFVDARLGDVDQGVIVRRLEPDEGNQSMFHQANPSQLLTLAQAVYGGAPPAWMVTIPAVEFGVGESLSPTARSGLVDALVQIARLLDA